jgi:hypothetical protein
VDSFANDVVGEFYVVVRLICRLVSLILGVDSFVWYMVLTFSFHDLLTRREQKDSICDGERGHINGICKGESERDNGN